MSAISRDESNAEKEELAELTELAEAMRICQYYKTNGYYKTSYDNLKKVIGLIREAFKHNDNVAKRSCQVLDDIYLDRREKRSASLLKAQEEEIIRITLNIGTHLTLIETHFNHFMHLWVQRGSRGPTYTEELLQTKMETVIEQLAILIKAITRLARLEDSIRKKG